MARCPAAKRAFTVVDASRRAEFDNAISFYEHDVKLPRPRWFFYDDERGKIVNPDPLFDALHAAFRGKGHWRIILGTAAGVDSFSPLAIRNSAGFYETVVWGIVQFNNASDAVKARMLVEEW